MIGGAQDWQHQALVVWYQGGGIGFVHLPTYANPK